MRVALGIIIVLLVIEIRYSTAQYGDTGSDTTPEEADCVRNCMRNNTNWNEGCCGCCGDDQCQGNLIQPLCCERSKSWCGCISNRAYCNGKIFNSSRSVSVFGTCYDSSDPETYSCCYYPSPNEWIICPRGTTCCHTYGSFNALTCCYGDEVCSADSNGSAVCKKAQGSSSNQCSGFDCGMDSCCNELTGPRCYDPNTASCTVNDIGQNVLCGKDLASCRDICYNPASYCCEDGALVQLQFCQNPTSPPTQTPSCPTPSRSCEQIQCGIAEECCNDINAGPQCFDPRLNTCAVNDNNQNVLCPKALSACGRSCYDSSQYCCLNGNLQQIEFCPVITTATATGGEISTTSAGPMTTGEITTAEQSTSGSTSTTTTEATTESTLSSTGGITAVSTSGGTTGEAVSCGGGVCQPNFQCCGEECFDPRSYVCFANSVGTGHFICPKGHQPCDSSCYDPTAFQCQRGILVNRTSWTCGDSCGPMEGCCGGQPFANSPFCYNVQNSTCCVGFVLSTSCRYLENGKAESCCSFLNGIACINPDTHFCCASKYGLPCPKDQPSCCP